MGNFEGHHFRGRGRPILALFACLPGRMARNRCKVTVRNSLAARRDYAPGGLATCLPQGTYLFPSCLTLLV